MIDKLFYQSGRLNLTVRPELKEILDELKKLTDFYPGYLPKQKNGKDKNGDIICRVKIYKEKLTKNDLTCNNEDCNNFVNYEFQKQIFTDYCCKKCKSNSKEIKEKIADTLESKYGSRTLGGNKDFRKKAENTMMKKYGVKNASHSETLKNKAKHILGVDNASQLKIKNYEYWKDANYIEQNFLDDKKQILVKKMCNFFNCQQPAVHRKFRDLNIDYIKRRCNSEAETEIINFINNPDIIQGNRTLISKELDILLPGKFAVEYNGLMFHSHGISKYNMFHNPEEIKNRHLIKTDLCEEKNIQLFQIFENEWLTKQDIWKSVINSKMNRTNKIFARKCLIKEVSASKAAEFEIKNHLQGKGISSIRYGLYYKDELVSLMTFKKDTKYQYELNRFCSKLNTTVVGGASKLLKHFERMMNPKSIVSYANRRWSTGNLYNTIGFQFSHISSPNYFYFHENNLNQLYSRVSFQKHKLKHKLKIFNESLSETENMYNNGYRKIFDSGNLVYIKIYKQ